MTGAGPPTRPNGGGAGPSHSSCALSTAAVIWVQTRDPRGAASDPPVRRRLMRAPPRRVAAVDSPRPRASTAAAV